MSALVATVVPWPKNETSLACAAIRASASLSPSATACDGSAGVEETFQTSIRPLLSSNRQISVNVPPESTPIRHPIVVFRDLPIRGSSSRETGAGATRWGISRALGGAAPPARLWASGEPRSKPASTRYAELYTGNHAVATVAEFAVATAFCVLRSAAGAPERIIGRSLTGSAASPQSAACQVRSGSC